tara:strand:- start:36 stop:341 length:306 start_codon:yes stop_codon:yes gene_type:complete
MVRRKKLAFKKLPLQKILIYLGVTALLIVIWAALAVIIKAVAVVYLLYRFIKGIFGGFKDPFDIIHLFLAIILVALAFIISSTAFLVILIIVIWLSAFLDD